MTNTTNRQCTQCQAMLNLDAKFCHLCGASVSIPQPVNTHQRQSDQQDTGAQAPKLVRIQEQNQGAYSIQIPKGWHYAASIQLYPDGNAVSHWQTQDPSGKVSISCPGTMYSFQEPVAAFFGPMFPNRRPMQYMPAQAFIQRCLLPQLRASYPAMQVEQVADRPELMAEMIRLYKSTGQNPAQAQFSVASVRFTFTQQGQSYRQEMYISLLRLPALRIWDACVSGQLRAPVAQFEQYMPLLSTIGKSFQWNQQWLQARNVQNQQLAAQIMQQGQMHLQASMAQSRQQQQFIMQTGDIIKAGQAHRMAVQEQNFNAMDNIIAGNIDLRDSNGQIYNVTNDYQPRHWIDGLGQVHGGGWNTTPSPHWTPLEPTE